jgi:hypothetical protein
MIQLWSFGEVDFRRSNFGGVEGGDQRIEPRF